MQFMQLLNLFLLFINTGHLLHFANAVPPFVLFPAAFFWNSTNKVHVTPLLEGQNAVDIILTVEEDDGGSLRYIVFTKKLTHRPTKETSTFYVVLPENSTALRYYVTVNLVGHTEFHAHINGAANIAKIFLQTDKVFYKPREIVSVRALPISQKGKLFKGFIEFKLLDPKGFRIFNRTLKANTDEDFIETNFELPNYVRFGEWKVTAGAGNSFRRTEVPIRLKEYTLPKFHLLLTIHESEQSPFVVSATVLAKFANGRMLEGKIFLGCELFPTSDSAYNNAEGDDLSSFQKKLVQAELHDGKWQGFLNVSECLHAIFVQNTAGNRASSHSSAIPPLTRMLITTEVHERDTFMVNRAAVEYDPNAPDFDIVSLRPGYTQQQRSISLYLRPIKNGVLSNNIGTIRSAPVELVSQCVSADAAVNGLNRSLGDQRIGTVVEVQVDLQCTVLLIKGRIRYGSLSNTHHNNRGSSNIFYSREQRLIIPSFFHTDFLRFDLIQIIGDDKSKHKPKAKFRVGEKLNIILPSNRSLNYFISCNSREIVAAENVPANGRLSLIITSAMSGACLLYVYGINNQVPYFDMHLFFVFDDPFCSDEYSLKLSAENVSVFAPVDVFLRAPPSSLISLHAYDSRLDTLAARLQPLNTAIHIESLSHQFWTFAEFRSPVLKSDSVFHANLLPIDELNRQLRMICALAGYQTPQCPSNNIPLQMSISLLSDVCMREFVRSCNDQSKTVSNLSGLQDHRAMKPEVAIASYAIQNLQTLPHRHGSHDKHTESALSADPLGDILDMQRLADVKITNDLQVTTLRDFFPEVWLFDAYKIGLKGVLNAKITAPHSVTQWRVGAYFWTRGQQKVCFAQPRSLYALKNVFMDVDLPLHVYENETVQIRVTVTADKLNETTNMAVCFGGLSPIVCGDVGRNGTLGETDYTRIVLSFKNSVQIKKFYVRFLSSGMHNLTFELREESALPGGDWHCRDSEARLFDRITRQVRVDERIDLEENYRQIVVYKTKRLLPQDDSGMLGNPVTPADVPELKRLAGSDIIKYLQTYRDIDESLLTQIYINSFEKVYSITLEFAKFVPGLSPSLSALDWALLDASILANNAQLSPLQNTPQFDAANFQAIANSKRELYYLKQKRELRSIFSKRSGREARFSLSTVVRDLAAATYELKPLGKIGIVFGDEIERRKYLIGNLLSELLTYSDCDSDSTDSNDNLNSGSKCGFGEFGRPRHSSQRNILLSILATSLLCEQNAPPEFVCGPSRFLADIVQQLNTTTGSRIEIDLGFSTQILFDTYNDKVLFLQCLLVRMVLDCGMYQCIQAERSAWQSLHRDFFAFDERYVRDVRLEATLAYVSTPSTRQLMRLRLAGKAKTDRLPFWNTISPKRVVSNLLENGLLKSGNILTNSLAILAYSANQQLYEFWRNQFDFDTLAGWLTEHQSAGGHYENAIDTYFGCRAMYSYRIANGPVGFEARQITANLSASTIQPQRHFSGKELPFALSISPLTRMLNLSTRGEARLIVGVRVLAGRRRRSKRDPTENYPVSICMTQTRNAVTNFINQTVILSTHSAMLTHLEIEHGIFTGFSTKPTLIQLKSNTARYYYEPQISATAVHFVLENVKKDQPITYTIMLIEPLDSYLPNELAPIAISAIYHRVVGRLIVLPSSVSFDVQEYDGRHILKSNDNFVAHPSAVRHNGVKAPHLGVHRSRSRIESRKRVRREHIQNRRQNTENNENDEEWNFVPNPSQFDNNRENDGSKPVVANPLHYHLGETVSVRQAIEEGSPPILRDSERDLAAANLQSSTDELVETVCLENGVCTCAEMTCQIQCTNCSALTFRSLCDEFQRTSRFSLIFRILDRKTVEINRVSYTVFDVRILDWLANAEPPEVLSVWIRECNLQCLRMTQIMNGGSPTKPRFLLIGDVRGLFNEAGGMSGTLWVDDTLDFTGGANGDLEDKVEERKRKMRAASMTSASGESRSTGRKLGTSTWRERKRRVRDSLLRTHYVMRDNDRLARSTDCWPLFGRLQDEQCDSSPHDEL